jgi:hypothetical protein
MWSFRKRLVRSWSLAFIVFLSGVSVALAAQYLNFVIQCTGSGPGGCASGATIFQGSIEIPTGSTSGSATIVPGSATSYIQPNGVWGATPQSPSSITGTVSYSCTNGLCHVTSLNSLTVNYTGGSAFLFNGSSPAPGSTDGHIKITRTQPSSKEITDSAYGNCASGSSGRNCLLSANPLHHPEINGATLPRAVLLLASILFLMRNRNLIRKQPLRGGGAYP